MSDNLLEKAEKLNKLVMDILYQCTNIKLAANSMDGSTARWIEREMEEMVNKVKVYLND